MWLLRMHGPGQSLRRQWADMHVDLRLFSAGWPEEHIKDCGILHGRAHWQLQMSFHLNNEAGLDCRTKEDLQA